MLGATTPFRWLSCAVPPVPIPNTEVKRTYTDNTWLETAREDRQLPGSKETQKCVSFLFACTKSDRRFTAGCMILDHIMINSLKSRIVDSLSRRSLERQTGKDAFEHLPRVKLLISHSIVFSASICLIVLWSSVLHSVCPFAFRPITIAAASEGLVNT